MLYVCTKYSMCDLICDVIINVYDKIMIENHK